MLQYIRSTTSDLTKDNNSPFFMQSSAEVLISSTGFEGPLLTGIFGEDYNANFDRFKKQYESDAFHIRCYSLQGSKLYDQFNPLTFLSL